MFKRQVDNLLSSDRDRPQVSLEDDLRTQFDQALSNAIDPDRERREAEREAANLEHIRTQKGLGQFVQIDGIPGQWEAVELFYFDDTSASFTLVDRNTGQTAQLSGVDDGTVILDSPGDQHGATIPGAFWRTATTTGVRLNSAVLTSDGRPIVVSCDLSAEAPAEEISA
jgi:hypothetical protein